MQPPLVVTLYNERNASVRASKTGLYLKDHGHTVLNPALPDDDFDAAVRIAQAVGERKPQAMRLCDLL